MTNLVLRTVKGAPVTNEELDQNQLNLANDTANRIKNSTDWISSTSVQQGQILHYSGRFYLVTTGGATGVTGPSHTSGSATNGTCVLDIYTITEYSPRDILNKLMLVDGPGSGLDADKVDGLDVSSSLPVGVDKSSIVSRNSSGNIVVNNVTGDLTGTATNANTVGGLSPSSSLPVGVDKSSVVSRNSSGDITANAVTASTFTGNLTGTATNANTVGGLSPTQLNQTAIDEAFALIIALG